ncbi:MAG TPA: pseudouridine synthase [Gammaproteobacteria bacterium]|nr:pseudouridine synthase [Gammaproteobacteria bacterium]
MPTLLFNKPYGVICQFSGNDKRRALADFISVKDVYPAGRLDTDSEGLLILTDDGRLQSRISHPRYKLPKTYLAQLERVPAETDLERLRTGITLNDGPTLPAEARLIPEPENLWPRDPPIRFRKAIPTAWIELTLHEGRNRQVRRMTAAIGHPTLRLIRWQIGDWTLEELKPGEWREIKMI